MNFTKYYRTSFFPHFGNCFSFKLASKPYSTESDRSCGLKILKDASHWG